MTRSVSVTTAVRLRAPMIKSPHRVAGFATVRPRLGDGHRWVGCHRVGCVLPVHSGCVASAACGGAEATARSRRSSHEHRTARNTPDR